MKENNNPFENKIRSKLEAYEAPYKPEYWKQYKKKYQTAIWLEWAKRWYMPYLFNSLLIGALAWIFWHQNSFEKGLYYREIKTDTVYVYQSITQKDTLVVYDTVYVYSSPSLNTLRRNGIAIQNPVANNNTISNSPQTIAIAHQNKEINSDEPTGISEPQQALTEEQILKAQFKELVRLQRQRRAQADSIKNLEDNLNIVNGEPQETIGDTLTLEEPENVESLSARMQAKEPKAEKTNEDKKQRKPRQWKYGIGLIGSYYLPFDYQNIDFMGGASAGISASAGVHRWGIELGVHPGMQIFEYDNLDLEDAQRFPGYSNLTIVPEDIEIWTTQLFMPIQIGYDFIKRPSWGLSARTGVLSQVLISENYEYVFDEGDQEIIRSAPTSSRFLLTHITVGLNTYYKISSKWQIESGVMYQHPLLPLGYSRLRTPLLPMTVGIRRIF
jgi:hypothetical protein